MKAIDPAWLAALEIEMAKGDFFRFIESRVKLLQHRQQSADGAAGGIVFESKIGIGERRESLQFRAQFDRWGQASIVQLQPGLRHRMPLAATANRGVPPAIEEGCVEGKHWRIPGFRHAHSLQTSTCRVLARNWWISASVRGSIMYTGRLPFGHGSRGVVPNKRQISGRSP